MMRVIAGTARGKNLAALPGEDVTRPTINRVKEAMFSSVQFSVPGARVLEVGPGLGVMTEELLRRGARVTAVEKDPALAAWLRESLCREFPDTLELLEGDALDCDWPALLARGFSAFASNLPYSVGTRILMDLIGQPGAPDRLVTLVQREVADRFAAAPGTPARGTAAVWLQLDYDVRVERLVKPSCFWPPPEVTSAVVRMERHGRSTLNAEGKAFLRALSKQVFTPVSYTHLRAHET